MNVNLLKGHLRMAGLTQEAMAEKMGISLSRFNAKLNERGNAEFSLGEADTLRKTLELSDKEFCKIFLSRR